MISEIEEDYNKILKKFESHLSNENAYRFKELSEEYLLKLLRDVMNFQRKLEYFIESTYRLAKEVALVKRLEEIADKLLKKLSADEIENVVKFYSPGYGYNEYMVKGVISRLQDSHKKLLYGDTSDSKRFCYCSYFAFKLLQSDLIEIEEEMRLIGALTAYPIEKKTKLKHQLVINDFEEVAVSLEEAESNVETEHFKDCVSRCRDAIEIFVSLVRENETGEKTERHFAADLGKLVKIEVFDVGVQRLAQGVYSFLSLKGSHKYDAKKVSVYDAETSLKETYSLLEMLLNKYSDFKKQEKKQIRVKRKT